MGNQLSLIVYIFGFPGVGKLTIAKELQKHLKDCCLVDNHSVNNVLFPLVDRNLAVWNKNFWSNINKIWDVVSDTIIHQSPPSRSFIVTNVLLNKSPGDQHWYKRIFNTAKTRGSVFIPVRLHCGIREHKRRIVSRGRRERHKLDDVDVIEIMHERRKVLKVRHKNLLELDVTNMSARKAAGSIFRHIKKINSVKAKARSV